MLSLRFCSCVLLLASTGLIGWLHLSVGKAWQEGLQVARPWQAAHADPAWVQRNGRVKDELTFSKHDYTKIYRQLRTMEDVERLSSDWDWDFLFVIYTQRTVREVKKRFHHIQRSAPAFIRRPPPAPCSSWTPASPSSRPSCTAAPDSGRERSTP